VKEFGEGPASYSCLTPLPGGETGSKSACEKIVFARFLPE
jgi:hypothetical protein